jgi:hypothetical protein
MLLGGEAAMIGRMFSVSAALSLALVLGPLAGAGGAEDDELAKSVLPVDLRVYSEPSPFEVMSGPGLAYELHIASYRRIDLSLLQLDVFAVGEHDGLLGSLRGEDLLACLRRPGQPAELADPEVLHGGDFLVAFLWVALQPGSPVPEKLAHRATFRLVRPDGTEKQYVVEGAAVDISTRAPIQLQAPLPAARWLMANGPSKLGDHRLFLSTMDGRTSNTQRFASDWMLLGPDNALVDGDIEHNRSWHGYGVPVLAVAEGVVVDLADGLPDNVPLAEERAVPMTREGMVGNYVVLQLEEDRYAFYGHLKAGTLAVAVGDRVAAGQELGRVGNSGNSDAPHLHFHVADSPDPLSGEGVPFAFTSFVVLDELDVASWERMLSGSVSWKEPADGEPSLRTREMPTGELIVELR